MTQIDKTLIERRLNRILEYYDELKPHLELSNKDIKEARPILRSVERLFSLIVDEAIDINNHIITTHSYTVPDDYHGTFTILGSNEVVPSKFATKIAGSVGLRNKIVHVYEVIDVDEMLDKIKTNISDYEEYMKLITAYISK